MCVKKWRETTDEDIKEKTICYYYGVLCPFSDNVKLNNGMWEIKLEPLDIIFDDTFKITLTTSSGQIFEVKSRIKTFASRHVIKFKCEENVDFITIKYRYYH